MSKGRKGPTTTRRQSTQSPDLSVESGEVEILRGLKYKSLKLGPIALPWYASPESQLILVSFVSFLFPGKPLQHNILLQITDCVKACSMLSTALVLLGSSANMLLLLTPQTPHSTLLSLLSVSSLTPSSTPSASGSPSHLVVLDTVSMSAHIYATATPRTSAILSLPASCLDPVQAFSGLRKAQSCCRIHRRSSKADLYPGSGPSSIRALSSAV